MIDKVQTIGISGMAGVGKTTLVNHIHNKLREETQDHLYWITVSELFTIHKLQDDIATLIGFDLSKENNEDIRAATINRALSQRNNFSLILDDVWTTIDLDKLGDPLSVEGCRLIITTRSLEVCRRMKCKKTIKVEKLLKDEAWNLFKSTLGHEMILTPEVQEIAMSVSEECDGLPLGLITIAGSMRGVSETHVWRHTLREFKQSVWQYDMEEVFQILKYSFDRLGPNERRAQEMNWYTNLQLCFLHFSLYPEDYKIDKANLVNHFIREKLVDRGMSWTAEFDQGLSMLDKLVDVGLLETLDGGKCVRMHDLVRDMASKITRDDPKFKVFSRFSLEAIPNEEEGPGDLNKMCLMLNDISQIPNGMSPNCPKISTLLFFENHLTFKPDSFFSMMSGLNVLDLTSIPIEVLPDSISDLESLHALILTDCSMLTTVPNLGKLKALRMLYLLGTLINKVPQGMENLVNLRYFPNLQCLLCESHQ